MKIVHLLIVVAFMLLTSCSAKISSSIQNAYSPLEYYEDVLVLGLVEEVPHSAEKLGTLKAGDSGFTVKCGYIDVVEKLELEARKIGGNAIKIIKHKTPDAWSTCHRVTADVYRIDNLAEYIRLPNENFTDTTLFYSNSAILNV